MKWIMSIVALIVATTVFAQTVTIETVFNIAQTLGVFDIEAHPDLEQTEENEAENIKKIAQLMFSHQMNTEPQSRDAHAKGHACAEATFTVQENIPTELRAGMFAEAKPYPAIIRFSNGNGATKSDAEPDGRGMAVKVIDGAKDGNILGTGTTQDFMMINNPRFFIGSVRDYLFFASVVAEKPNEQPIKFFLVRGIREALTEAGFDGENYPMENIIKIAAAVAVFEQDKLALGKAVVDLFGWKSTWVLPVLLVKLKNLKAGTAPLELAIVKQISRTTGSLVTESYFSMSSYLAKSNVAQDTAVKYSARPVSCQDSAALISPLAAPQNISEKYLKTQLAEALANNETCYNFYMQPLPTKISAEEKKRLVEDPRLDFNTSEVLVAKLRIPVQSVDVPSKLDYCEGLSYNPWQADADLRPLGGLNRTRKVAVTASSIRRHFVTGQERQEPTSIENFVNLQ